MAGPIDAPATRRERPLLRKWASRVFLAALWIASLLFVRQRASRGGYDRCVADRVVRVGRAGKEQLAEEAKAKRLGVHVGACPRSGERAECPKCPPPKDRAADATTTTTTTTTGGANAAKAEACPSCPACDAPAPVAAAAAAEEAKKEGDAATKAAATEEKTKTTTTTTTKEEDAPANATEAPANATEAAEDAKLLERTKPMEMRMVTTAMEAATTAMPRRPKDTGKKKLADDDDGDAAVHCDPCPACEKCETPC